MLKELGPKIKSKYLVLLAFRTPFETIRTLVNAFFLKSAFGAMNQLDYKKLLTVCLFFLLENAGLFTYNGTIWRFFGKHYAHMQGQLNLFIMKKLLKKDIEQIDSLSSGDVLTHLNQDAQMAMSIYGEPWNLVFLLNGICTFIISSIFLYNVSAKLYLLVIAFVIPHVLINSYIIAPAQSRLQTKIQETSAELTDMYTSYVNLSDIIQLYDCNQFMLNKISEKNDEIRKLSVRKSILSAISNAIIPLFGLSGYLVLMIAGANMIFAGVITYGTLLYACQLRNGLLPGSMMIINSITNIKINKVGEKRINSL